MQGTRFSGRVYPPESEHAALRDASRRARALDARPNLLLLLTDQQTLNALSCAGNRWVHTPNMDRLAAAGVRFTRSWCAAPICTPARASLFTGYLPHQVGANYLHEPLRPGVPTLGTRLQCAGYDTTYTGKWHLPSSWPAGASDIPGYINLPLPPDLKRSHLGDITDFLIATDAEYYLAYHAALSPRPWHLVVSLHNPHDICHFCMRHPGVHPAGDSLPGLPPLPENFEATTDEPEMLRWRRAQKNYAAELPHTESWSSLEWRTYLYAYYRWVESADRALGIVLDALEKGGHGNNTLIVFTSDHGEGMAAHRWATKLSLYEESLSVPLILCPPASLDPSVPRVDHSQLCSGIDIVPTLMDYAGLAPDPTLPGISLRPAIERSDAPQRRALVFAEMAVNRHHPDWQARCVSDGRHKYVAWSGGGRPEQLFDLACDPGETRNLATEPSQEKHLRMLRDGLSEWLKRTEDPFPSPSRRYPA